MRDQSRGYSPGMGLRFLAVVGKSSRREPISGVFDVHYHLVFGVDDGPKTIEDSLALAQASIAEGVTHIVATPHANFEYPFQPEVNLQRLQELQQRLDGRLKVALGCDFHLSYDNIADLEQNPRRYTINGTQYLLVEFGEFVPRSLSEVIFHMRGSGIVPIITHPERNAVLGADFPRIEEWIMSGCLVQITAGSLLGDFRGKPKSIALNMIRKNLVHIVASDAHSVRWRPPSMKRAHAFLVEEFGQETADRLCIHNPRAVFFGEPLPPQPSPSLKDRGFFSRWFGKRR